jgi:hypothetical protein
VAVRRIKDGDAYPRINSWSLPEKPVGTVSEPPAEVLPGLLLAVILKEGSGLFLGLRPADDKNMIVSSVRRTVFAFTSGLLAGLVAGGAGLVAYWWSR